MPLTESQRARYRRTLTALAAELRASLAQADPSAESIVPAGGQRSHAPIRQAP